jgi:uncharacterized paraquat-inducible protein A
MWNRACPLCFTKVPRKLILGSEEKLVCPRCRTPLELSPAARLLGVICGLVAAFAAVRLILATNLAGTWILQVIAAVLVYVVASSAVLYFFSDLVVRRDGAAEDFPHAQK